MVPAEFVKRLMDLERKVNMVLGICDPADIVVEETDPIFTASPAYTIESQDILNWKQAFSWGNHAAAGYLNGSGTANKIAMWSGTKILTDSVMTQTANKVRIESPAQIDFGLFSVGGTRPDGTYSIDVNNGAGGIQVFVSGGFYMSQSDVGDVGINWNSNKKFIFTNNLSQEPMIQLKTGEVRVEPVLVARGGIATGDINTVGVVYMSNPNNVMPSPIGAAGILYTYSGNLYFRSEQGTVTMLAPY